MNPHTARLSVRFKTFPNREVEIESIRAIDEAVFDKVRQVEAFSIASAERFMVKDGWTQQAAMDVAAEIGDLRKALANGTLDPTPEVAERYELLRTRAASVAAALANHEKEAEFHAQQVSDPYDAYVKMTEKFQILRPNLDV